MKAAIKRLENGSIALLPLDVAHASEYIRLANEQTIAEAVNNPLPYERHHFDGLLEQISKNPRLFVWMIALDGIICGAINSSAMRSPQMFQGGYWIEPQFRGKGIGAKAQMLVRNFLVKECHAIRIQALVEPSNDPSIRV
ncbi:MAG: GNAT family N-acetyltransferase, partial [Rickettsiales bacterium]|nr:GNAT family N-acetyltransferase [Rickettsiales bacterium]